MSDKLKSEGAVLVDLIRGADVGTRELQALVEQIDELLSCQREWQFRQDLHDWDGLNKERAKNKERKFIAMLRKRAIEKRFFEIREEQGKDTNMAKLLSRSSLSFKRYSSPNKYCTVEFSISLNKAKKEAARLRKKYPIE